MVYDVNAKAVFLTYPQCPVPVKDAFDLLKLKHGSAKLLVAGEFHADGSRHLHVFMKRTGVVARHDWTHFDIDHPTIKSTMVNVKGYQGIVRPDGCWHGNYAGARSEKNVLKYCNKDGDYLADFDVAAAIARLCKDRRVLGAELLGKRDIHEIIDENPNLVFGYKRLIEDIALFNHHRHIPFNPYRPDPRDGCYTWLPNPWGLCLPSKVRSKKRHIWMWSQQPNAGKTTKFADPIFDNVRSWYVSGKYTGFWDGLLPDCEVIIWDEYTHQLEFNELNALADGRSQFNLKGRPAIRLDHPLIIILGNNSIENCYPIKYPFLYARFREIELVSNGKHIFK